MKLFLPTTFMAIAMVAAGAAHAQPHVHDAWSGPSKNPMMGAAYMTVKSDVPCRLVEVKGTVSDVVEIHTHEKVGDVFQMRKIDGIDITPDAPATLAPGGLHIMLIGLNAPLKDGDNFPLEFVFEGKGCDAQTVNVPVSKEKQAANLKARGTKKMDDVSGHHHHGH